jgi:hypothetical protein
VNKNELRFSLDRGITVIIKIPDHQPPHVHAYRNHKQQDVIFINGKQLRDNYPGFLSEAELKICQKWIRVNQDELLRLWRKLEEMGHITKPQIIKKEKKAIGY